MKNRIEQERIKAMKSGDVVKRDLLSTLLAELSRPKVVDYSDAAVISAIKKMIENAKICSNIDEVEILQSFLPEQLTEADITKILVNLLNDGVITDITQLGVFMKWMKQNHEGKYDGKLASDVYKKFMSNVK